MTVWLSVQVPCRRVADEAAQVRTRKVVADSAGDGRTEHQIAKSDVSGARPAPPSQQTVRICWQRSVVSCSLRAGNMSNFKALPGVLAWLALVGCGGSSSHVSASDPTPDVGGAGAAGTPSKGNAGESGANAGTGASSASGGASGGASAGASSASGGTSGASAGASGASTGGTSAGGRGGSDAGGTAGAAASPPTIGCAGWTFDLAKGTLADVTMISGGARFTRPATTSDPSVTYFNGADVAIEQTGLTGDFDVKVSFKDFVPGKGKSFSSPRAEAGVWWHDPATGNIYQAIGLVGGISIGAVVSHGHQFTINYPPTPAGSLDGASGSFQVTRVGTVVTVKTLVNGQLASAQSELSEPFSEEPLTLFLSLDDEGRAFDDPPQDSAITFTQVQVTGGGGQVKSEDFSCP